MRHIRLSLVLGIFFACAVLRANPARDTAINRLGVPLFSVNQGVGSTVSYNKLRAVIRDGITSELNSKSFLQAHKINSVINLSAQKAQLKSVAKSSDLEAVLIGELRPRQMRMALFSAAGTRHLVRWIVPLPKKLNKSSIDGLIKEVVDLLVQALPYRGFVSEAKGENVKITIGKEESIAVGNRLQLFEFDGDQPNFSSPQSYVGEVEVTKVSKRQALARKVKGDTPRFAKVSFRNDFRNTLSALNRNSEGAWATLGVSAMSMDTKFKKGELLSRDYDLAFTPFANLALGWGPVELEAIYGSAESSLNKVTFMFLSGSFSLLSWGAPRKGYVLSLGALVRQFTTTKKDVTGEELGDASGIHPFADLRWTRVPRDRTKIFVGGRFLWPMLEKGGDSVTAFTSFGVRLYSGIRIDISKQIGIEAEVRGQYSQITLLGDLALTETQLGLFSRAIIFF